MQYTNTSTTQILNYQNIHDGIILDNVPLND